MITSSFSLTATERVLPRLALDFTTASLDPRVTFTRTSGASNPATYIDSSGVITAATNNQPRFDYDPVTLVCKGLLIEESRTNSLLNSDTLSTQSVTVTAAARTLSFYGTGQVVLSGAHSATVSGTGAYPTRTTLTFTPSAGTLTLTVTGTVQYAQLEVGAFATSYIPTTSAALTRNADVATMTGTNFSDWFNASEGAVEAQYIKNSASSATSPAMFYSPTVSQGMTFWINTDGMNTRYWIGATNSTIGTGSLGSVMKASFTYGATKTGSLNAAAVVSNAGTIPSDISRLQIGQYGTGTTGFLNGYVQKINYWPQRLTDNEVRAFSK